MHGDVHVLCLSVISFGSQIPGIYQVNCKKVLDKAEFVVCTIDTDLIRKNEQEGGHYKMKKYITAKRLIILSVFAIINVAWLFLRYIPYHRCREKMDVIDDHGLLSYGKVADPNETSVPVPGAPVLQPCGVPPGSAPYRCGWKMHSPPLSWCKGLLRSPGRHHAKIVR